MADDTKNEAQGSGQAPEKQINLNDLDSLIVKGKLEAEVEYKDGLIFKLRYVSRTSLNSVSQSCIEHVWSGQSKSRQPRLNTDKFVEQFCRMAVLGWRGATLKVLSGICPIDTAGLSEAQLNAPVPFSQENLVTMMKNAFDLDEFLQNAATDVKFFNTSPSEGELGN